MTMRYNGRHALAFDRVLSIRIVSRLHTGREVSAGAYIYNYGGLYGDGIDEPPHFPMPAIPMQIERMEDGWPVLVEMYRTNSGSSSVTITHIGSADDLYNW